MRCAEFFQEYPDGKKFKHLLGTDEAVLIAMEAESASSYSPGPVENDELLYHQILDPTNLTEDGAGLAPKSFDTATGIGMSVNRAAVATFEQIVEIGRARADNFNKEHPENPQKRSLWGFVPINASLVREMISKVTNTRGLFVFDTALPKDKSHADIAQLTRDQKGTRAIRLELYDMVKGAAFRVEQSS
jgi:hypothetical protein